MRKESFQGILLGVVIMCAVFAFITIAWAAFSSTLTIGGTATINAQSWDIDFVSNYADSKSGDPADYTNKWTAAQTLTGVVASGSNAVLPVSDGLSISADRVVSGAVGTFNQQGDKITYTWYAQNFGTFNADVAVVTIGDPAIGSYSVTNTADGNIDVTCTDTSNATNANITAFCAAHVKATLSVGAVGSSAAYGSGNDSWTLAKSNTTDRSDVLEFKLEVEFVDSSNSNANSPTVSPDDIKVTIPTISLSVTQTTTSA